MRSEPVPESLREADLQPVWAAVRRHLDRHGPQKRGSVALPGVGPTGEMALKSMLGRITKRLDLTQLETALMDLGTGRDLSDAMTRLGHPPSEPAARRRADRARADAARQSLRSTAASWPEPWATKWAEGLIRDGLLGGLDDREIETLVRDVRRLMDRIDQNGLPPAPQVSAPPGPAARVEPPLTSRTELAATLFGSSHALDPGTKLASFATRALRWRLDLASQGRQLWEAAGIQADRVSAPALVWAVPATGQSALDKLLRAADGGALPVHVSLLALQCHRVSVPAGTRVLVVENPRLVEAAAERHLERCVVATNGNPSTAVTALLDQMRDSGASLWYHGDFDPAGIAICGRMHDSGCQPWMMDESDYRHAVRSAERDRVRLDRAVKDCGPTPWDPQLEAAFNEERLIVHEEFILDHVLRAFAAMAPTEAR